VSPNKTKNNDNDTKDKDCVEHPFLQSSYTLPYVEGGRLSDIGESSSLFSYDSSPSFNFGDSTEVQHDRLQHFGPYSPSVKKRGREHLGTKSGISSLDFGGSSALRPSDPSLPFVFGITSNGEQRRNTQRKMVNERSPAKAVPRPGSSDNEKAPAPKYNFSSNMAEAPRFGQSSLPQSPLHRNPSMKSKEDAMFIKPKSRPEHHRDVDRSGVCRCETSGKDQTDMYSTSTPSCTQRCGT